MKPRPRPIGRGELLARAGACLAAGESVMVSGPPGIGKSTILDALADDAGSALVLRAAAVEAEVALPYLALVDLFDRAPPDATAGLPRHLRAALDGALLRSALPATPHDQLAVRLAVLEVLRGLAARSPVLLVLDDVQWVDEPSYGVLRFVARRVADARVSVLAAARVAAGGSTRVDVCPEPCLELTVPPLAESDVVDLVRRRFGAGVAGGNLRRVYQASGGNPLYAVELARALGTRSAPVPATEPLPVPDRLRSLLSARIAALPVADGRCLVTVATAARPSRALLERCGIDPEARLAAATAAGVLAVDPDGAIRFSHPLLREMVYADAEPALRREVHECLAVAATDPVERARHLAAARSAPDEALAGSLADAAAAARLRGAPAAAVDLAVLAAERTPADSPGLAAERWLAAAEYGMSAGLPVDAGRYARAALRQATDRRTRVHARLLLVQLAGQDQSGVGPLLDAAFCDAADAPDLLAHVRLHRAVKAYYDGDTEAALAELKRAEEAAEQCHRSERLVEVLSWRGSMLSGQEGDELLERAGELARGLPLTPAVVGARQLAAMGRLFRGDVDVAIRRIEALRVAVERSGTVRDLAAVLISVAGVYGRAGRCADALTAGRECARLYVDVETTPGPGLLVRAMTELNGGTVEQAAADAGAAVAACLDAGDEDWLKAAYATAGMVESLRGDPVAAARVLRQAYQLEQRLGRVDPGSLLWHADFIEVLVAVGARGEAAEVLAEVRAQAERYHRRVAMLGLERAAALLTAGTGRVREAADALGAAIDEWVDHPYPLELARAWHALGGLERRAHRRGAAREAFAEAVRRYDLAAAVPWREAAGHDLARLDGSRGAGLSPTERQIVEMVRAGATNRQIAGALFLSVKAVEANLTRLYRRLNVRNRDQLVRSVEP